MLHWREISYLNGMICCPVSHHYSLKKCDEILLKFMCISAELRTHFWLILYFIKRVFHGIPTNVYNYVVYITVSWSLTCRLNNILEEHAGSIFQPEHQHFHCCDNLKSKNQIIFQDNRKFSSLYTISFKRCLSVVQRKYFEWSFYVITLSNLSSTSIPSQHVRPLHQRV